MAGTDTAGKDGNESNALKGSSNAKGSGKRVVLLEFTGKELMNNRVFDTTSEHEARENGLWNENSAFRAVPIIIGHNDILPAIDAELDSMKEGEERVVRLPAEKAFGERRPDLIVVVHLSQFTERKIMPRPGLIVDLNGSLGRVQTVSGGRVRVDLNNDLAGKEVEYKLRIAKELESADEKCRALVDKFFPLKGTKAEARLESGKLTVELPKELAPQLARLVPAFSKTMKEIIPGITEIKIAETLETEKKDESEKQGEPAGPAEQAESKKLPDATIVPASVAEAKNNAIAKEKAEPKAEKRKLEVKKTDTTMIVRPSPKEKPKGIAPSQSTESTAIWHAKRKTRPS
ncbi:Putative FKBP-type peptidyl-prolyl cis-trans isomerase [uncultured archaeon]|nr:Putative FKBP-type peptidyl-prolyl cis-trans isomerase [uncultured archaeon]